MEPGIRKTDEIYVSVETPPPDQNQPDSQETVRFIKPPRKTPGFRHGDMSGVPVRRISGR